MLVARLLCSDAACAEAFEARSATLAELEALACDCGCALAIVGWPHDEPGTDGGVELVQLGA